MARVHVLVALSSVPALLACAASHECDTELSGEELQLSSMVPFDEVLFARTCTEPIGDEGSLRVVAQVGLHSAEGYEHHVTFVLEAPLAGDGPRASCAGGDLDDARFFLRVSPPLEHEPAEVEGPAELRVDALSVDSDGARATGSFAFSTERVDFGGTFRAPPCTH